MFIITIITTIPKYASMRYLAQDGYEDNSMNSMYQC